MMTVTFLGKEYVFDMDEQLKTLTGSESIMVEDYLGGWQGLTAQSNRTRAGVVFIWIAKRMAGEPATFEEIADTPGLMFGDDVFDLQDDDDKPEDPMVDPGRPLQSRNGSNGSTDGTTDSVAGPVTSASTGPHQ